MLCCEYRSVNSWKKKVKIGKCEGLGERSKQQENIDVVQNGKEPCRGGAIFMVSAGSGSYEATIQFENSLSWVVGG